MFSGIPIGKGETWQSVSVAELDEAQLPDGDVDVDVEYSTLNYKDALAITGRSPVVRKFPMVPGIGLARPKRELRGSHSWPPPTCLPDEVRRAQHVLPWLDSSHPPRHALFFSAEDIAQTGTGKMRSSEFKQLAARRLAAPS